MHFFPFKFTLLYYKWKKKKHITDSNAKLDLFNPDNVIQPPNNQTFLDVSSFDNRLT